ncbi:MAG: response regulator [Dysgonamonadaceae bacterium]|jgi:signal transduction histidine kinase/DNA-binding response OmpR family regulator/streptogramin lyase|nr:response regulator [Dysgonamonadaceae bacterium]
MNYKYLFALIVSLLWMLPCRSQPLSCHFEHYSIENGLPQYTIMGILQDSKGFMWFATWNGISKFNGHSFQNYKVQSSDSYYMNSNRIESMQEDKYGNIWMRSYDGATHCFDPHRETFKNLQAIPGYKDYPALLSKIEVKESGKVWLLIEKNGCVCITDSVFSVHTYNVNDGRLKGNTVFTVFEDKNYNSWILTNNGLFLAKNGQYETTPFFFDNSPNRDNQSFRSAIELNDEIWFGANRGRIWKYKKSTGKFNLLETNVDSYITGFTILSANELAIATSNDGLLVYRHDTNAFEPYHSSNTKELKNDNIELIAYDSLHQLWFVTNDLGIYKYDADTKKIKYFLVKTEDATMASSPSLPLVIEDIFHQIWVHPKGGGLSFYNKHTDSLDPFYNDSSSPDWRFSNILHTAFTDKQGILWFSTRSNGLEKVTFGNNNFNTIEINPDIKSSTANDVRAVLQDADNNIWVATKNCGLALYDEYFNRLGDLSNDGSIRKNQLLSSSVYSMMQDDAGNIWVGTRNDGLLKIRKTAHPLQYSVEHYRKTSDPYSLSENAIYSIFQDAKKNIWIGAYGGGINLVKTNPDGKISFINYRNRLKGYPIETCHRVRYISENKAGNICVGTTAGLILFASAFSTPEEIAYKYYARIPRNEESLTNNDIHGICNTRDGEMFIATFGGGLNKVTEVDAKGFPLKFKSFTVQNGLPSDVCLAVLEDGNGKLWISVENTLIKFDPKEEKFETFAEIRRVISKYNFSEASAIRLENNDMVFGFSDGILTFSPEKVKSSEFKPYIALSDFRLFNQSVSIADENSPLTKDIDDIDHLVLKHNQNFFSIAYNALDFILPDNILYAYKLEGFDNDWIYPQKQQIANYTNIPKGKYTFRIKSTNYEGIWVDNERQLSVQILPSFWETAWAYSLYFLLLLLLVFLIVYLSVTFYRLNSKMKMEKQVSEIKLRFFTDISHEIRTPLTMITAPVDYLITEKETPENIRKQLKLVSQNTNRLLHLVNQILDFRKVQQFKLAVKETDLGAAVADLCHSFEEVAQKRKINFRFINQAENEKVWLDPDCLEKIVMNLLSNAFKYTQDKKSIRVVVRKIENSLQIEVADEGKGIPKEKQKNLFTRFASFNDDKSKPSTGIGLFIVKDLVEKHGGKIEVDSDSYTGSVFTVSFLCGTNHFGKEVEIIATETLSRTNESMADSAKPELEAEPEKQDKKHSLLVVEDDTDLRKFIKTLLENEYTVIEAVDGEDGWEKAKNTNPAFIVSDIMMPRMDGIQLLQKIKDDIRTSHIPVVLLTSKTTIESKLEGLAHGADDYITKPFNVPYFRARIHNLFEQRKRLQEIYRNQLTELSEPEPEEPKPFIISLQDENILKKAVRIVEENMDNSDFSVEELCLAVGMSRSVFFNKVKSLTGLAPIEFIRDLKMKRAAQLLATNDYLVKEVSFMVGISDTKYFGKCFKTKYGVTPQAYKNYQ